MFENKQLGIFLLVVFIILAICNIFDKPSNRENYMDTYSIDLNADASNRMKRWNLYHSRRHSSLNRYIYPPIEYNCYYAEY